MEITTREKVRELLKQGKRQVDIAKELQIRECSVFHHIKSLKEEPILLERLSSIDWNEVQKFLNETKNKKQTLDKFNIPYRVWDLATKKKLLSGVAAIAVPLEDYLILGSKITSSHLKPKILEAGLLKNECVECGQPPEWKNKQLTLILDHINGNPEDNRIENLRILCPNCNSQTPTFCRGHKEKQKKKYFCKCGEKIWRTSKQCKKCLNDTFLTKENHCSCGTLIQKNSKQCISCFRKVQKKEGKNHLNFGPISRKFEISKEELEKLVWELPTTKIGKQFNVSDKAIEKRCKLFQISKPPRGYWQKKQKDFQKD